MSIEAEVPRRLLGRFQGAPGRHDGAMRSRRGGRGRALGSLRGGACAARSRAAVATPAPKLSRLHLSGAAAGLGTPAAQERHNAGWLWLQAGDLRGGASGIARALKRSRVLSGGGRARLRRARRERSQRGVEHFDRAVVANPRYVPALVGRGEALLALGEREKALESFEAAVAADPASARCGAVSRSCGSAGVQDDVAAARKAARRRTLDEAARYRAGDRRVARSPFLYRELAVVERRAGDLDAALAHARQGGGARSDRCPGAVLIGEILEARTITPRAPSPRADAALALEPNAAMSASSRRCAKRRPGAAAGRVQGDRLAPAVTRAQLAALVGVRLDAAHARARARAVVITDTRGIGPRPGSSRSRAPA